MKCNSVHTVLWLLKIALLCQSFGVFFYLLGGSAVETMLFMEMSFEQANSKLVEKIIAWIFLTLGVVTFFKPYNVLLILISLGTLGLAFVIKTQAGSPYTEWSIPAHSIRIILPLGILLLHTKSSYLKVSYWMLLVGIGVTFVTHGLEAWTLHPRFVDYLLISSENALGIRLKQSTAELILKIIGSMDILAVLIAFSFPRNAIFYWMASWGLITALARVTELGWVLYPEVLIRAAHFLVPISLILINKLDKGTSNY